MTKARKAVVVTTEHRGVFFGYLVSETQGGSVVKLARARCCIYWSSDVRGFVGLATNGPTNSCRIGPAADIKLQKVTSLLPLQTRLPIP